jgi:hypothetical protein
MTLRRENMFTYGVAGAVAAEGEHVDRRWRDPIDDLAIGQRELGVANLEAGGAPTAASADGIE